MTQFIIDFQAFKDEENRYILKEIAVIAVETDEVGHCIIKPPYPGDMLSEKCREQVSYIVTYQHGICWEDGYIKYVDAIRLVRDMTKNAVQVFIKGSERAKFIRKLTGKPTIDFDTLNCPRAKNLANVESSPDCFYYRHTPKYHMNFEACSLRRVYKLKEWYLNYLKKLSSIKSNEKAEDEHDTVEKGYDVVPSRIQECLRSRPTSSKSKFTRGSNY
ncbi:unnamed protein product [Brugia timori]|uniref:DUF3794 domain-containing protein n=1 Tax=Brugia timori TaxID=42155 RepID=A0A0R3Q8E4_9BILA|nr:unnamed protein product [Brugia timori]